MEKVGVNKTVVFKCILWLCLGIIFILPVFLIIMNAFKPNNDILTSFISFPKSLYLENFSEAMRIMNFWTVFRNTLFVTVCTVIVASAVSFMSAYGISHLPQKKGDKLYTLFVVGQIIPFHAVMIAISMLSTKLGLTNTHLGLIIFYSGFYTSFGVMPIVTVVDFTSGKIICTIVLKGPAPSIAAASSNSLGTLFRKPTYVITPNDV